MQMMVRATLVRIALLSTALGALTGCDTVGGAVELGRQLGRWIFLPSGSGRRQPQSRRDPRQIAGKPAGQCERKAEGAAGRFAGHQLPGGEHRRRRRGAARRRRGQCFGALSVQYRRHGAPMRSGRSGQAALKVGVAGQVVIGPAGAAGTFNAPMRITVTARAVMTSPFFPRPIGSRRRRTGSPPGSFALSQIRSLLR